MRRGLRAALCLALSACGAVVAQAQQQTAASVSDVRPSEPHVPLAQAAVAYDVAGNEALAPAEQVEVDTPGLRLTCTPSTWRIAATTLLTRTGDVAKPREQAAPPPAETGGGAAGAAPAPAAAGAVTTGGAGASAPARVPPLEINVNGKTIPLQLGNPLEVVVGKERVRIVVQQAP